MSFAYREIHIPSLLIAAIIGYQIAIYFFQQYRRSKHEQLQLNRILLAFGIFFSCLLAGFVIRVIYNYYVTDPVIVDMLSVSTILVIMISTVGFMAAVCDQAFSAIVRPRVTIVMIVINLVPIAAIFVLSYESMEYQLLLIIYTACLLYMLVFQLRLIKKATGSIKQRLITILAGEILLGISIAFGSEQIGLAFVGHNEIIQGIWLLAIYGAIIGLTIVFLGVFRFPAFLEFDWKDSLIQLLIIDNTSLVPIYTYTFSKAGGWSAAGAGGLGPGMDHPDQESMRVEFASHGLVGIDDIIQAIGREDGKKIESIAHGSVHILLQHHSAGFSPVTYALLVNRETKSTEYFLSTLKGQFEGFYKGVLHNLQSLKGISTKLFGSFDMIVKSLLA